MLRLDLNPKASHSDRLHRFIEPIRELQTRADVGIQVEAELEPYRPTARDSDWSGPKHSAARIGEQIGDASRTAKNLTNKTYAASVEAIADARQSTDNDSFNPANGRAFYGGIGWSW